MNPEQNQYPVDYLNQIAPQVQKPVMNKKGVFVLIGAVIFLLIIAVFAITSSGNGPVEKMQTLAARLKTLHTIATSSQKNIKSGALRSANSNLSIYLANTNRDIVAPLSKNGVNTKSINSSIEKKEKGEALTKTLEDARLNAIFDRTYARENELPVRDGSDIDARH